ncbi:hypothetical protein [Granulicoccus sp. GXG6511]|uniref:hypothetical protein n=1 Tax=Granulicoccus sp. GXG6511 TaxID=3381351 RepID=UPI003D7D765A
MTTTAQPLSEPEPQEPTVPSSPPDPDPHAPADAGANTLNPNLPSAVEQALEDLLEEPNLAATVIPGGFKPTKLQMLDAIIAAKNRQRAAEIDQLALVSGLCDAYSCLEPNPGGDAEPTARVLFGEHLLPPSIDGLPAIAEFFGHELGPALGISPDAAWVLVWDVLALRHRHPILWEHTLTGKVETWLARKAASACRSLPADLARQLDADLAPRMPGWGPRKTMTEVRAARARLDPEAEAERQQARRSRRADFTPHEDADGITRLEALLDALDALHLSGTINTLADILKKGGATGTADELRAVALGHLAHPDRAARLLQPDLLDGAAVTPDGHIINTATGDVVTDRDRQARCRHGAQFIIHLNGWDLAAGGGAEVEGIGRITHGHLHDLLASCTGRVIVRPVADLAAPMAVSAYRPSPEMVWRVKLRDGREMFPYSQRTAHSRWVDLDHTDPWKPGDETCTTNLGPNARRTHRAQTHGRFTTVQESAGTFRWTTPLGKTYWTNCHGTFTTPPADVVSNEPCHTTETVLDNLLRAAAARTPDAGQTTRQRARAAHRAFQQERAGVKATTEQDPQTPLADDDPWNPGLNDQPPPF